ncbi:MAG TPA: DUF192 domain-containing protein [Hellea balneolensis]|uniref:DUF192 domain-containing protein n=1 Tax=Hellea balneolensis TaxID=287478 RepID=A0A7C5R4G7_9PROT|nr:DUF192 domain-containing protein [Hellea balneolensis]
MKAMKSILITSVFALTGANVFAQGVPAAIDFGPKEKLTIVTQDGERNFNVEIADTPQERMRGLMFRDVIPASEGMLFEFETEELASIWMKNTSVFLDILFVRKDGTILKIEHSAKPYSLRSMSSEAPVSAVLELAGGQTLDLGIKPGDQIKHAFFK